jgi:hypothetical protein
MSLDAVRELGPALPGSSAIRRAELGPGSGPLHSLLGSASIKEVSLCFAVSFGIRASSAASRQGSRSSRANAETLSSMPFFFSPIGANKKASNSVARDSTIVECFLPTTALPVWGYGPYPPWSISLGRLPCQTRKLLIWAPAFEVLFIAQSIERRRDGPPKWTAVPSLTAATPGVATEQARLRMEDVNRPLVRKQLVLGLCTYQTTQSHLSSCLL